MNIDYETIRIPFNYVLIKPDENFKTYQLNGKETGIDVCLWGINAASHYSVRGVVYRLPEKLIYNGHRIRKLRQRMPVADAKDERNFERVNHYLSNSFDYESREMANLRRESMAYEIDCEVEIGDMVYFEYTTHLTAVKEGRVIDTEEGEMILVPYDNLFSCVPRGTDLNNINFNNIRMLNGFLLISPIQYDTYVEDGVEYFRNPGGVSIPVGELSTLVTMNNVGMAYVLAAGNLVRHYADFDKAYSDDPRTGKPGNKIFYDNRHHKRYEVEWHRTMFGDKKLYRIQRKDIHCEIPKELS